MKSISWGRRHLLQLWAYGWHKNHYWFLPYVDIGIKPSPLPDDRGEFQVLACLFILKRDIGFQYWYFLPPRKKGKRVEVSR